MFWIPTGIDNADGVTPLPSQPLGSGGGSATVGTPDKANSVQVTDGLGGNQISVNEDPESPIIERAEQATAEHRLKMSWLACRNLLAGLGRGTFLQDTNLNVWRVLSSRIKRVRAGVGELSYVAESISFDSPPDEFDCSPVELNLSIMKHPRYYYALNAFTVNPIFGGQNDFTTPAGDPNNPTVTVAQVKQNIIRAIQTYMDSPYIPNPNGLASAENIVLVGMVQSNIVAQMMNLTVPTLHTSVVSGSPASFFETAVDISNSICLQFAAAAAGEIIQKLWHQIDTPYIVGWQMVWSQFYFAPPPLNGVLSFNPGGYTEDPTAIVPDYFIVPTQTPGDPDIFSSFFQINPQCYDSEPSGNTSISWLRKADHIEYQRTWFKVTRTWIGSPVGYWDTELFSNVTRPHPVGSYPFGYIPLK